MLAESSTDKVIVGKVVNSKSTRERNNGFKRKQPRKKVVETNGEEGLAVKKQDHNAKERVRRKNLNASYLALGSMLPADSRRTKVESNTTTNPLLNFLLEDNFKLLPTNFV